MLGKLVQAEIDPSRFDLAAMAVTEELIPLFVAHPGARQGYWMANRTTGQVLVMTCWSDPASLEAARAQDGRERVNVAERIGLRVRAVDTLDVLGFEECHASEKPVLRFARATWVEGLSNVHDWSLRAMYREIVPLQRASPGFCASYWLGDAATGNGLGLSFWSGEPELRGDDTGSRRRRSTFKRAFGCRVDFVREYEALGVVAPSRIKSIDLTEAAASHSPMAPAAATPDLPTTGAAIP